MDRGVWWATVHGVAEWDTTELAYTHKLPPFCKVLRNYSPVTQSKGGQAVLPPGPTFLQLLYLAEA